MNKLPLSHFLAKNPFPHPLTTGFFYREKMRAIHHIAPNLPFKNILEVGGGQSGLTAALYPTAKIINLDYNIDYANAPCNRQRYVKFIFGTATNLPFKNQSFDMATMFDILEHIIDHEASIAEVLRVLRPGGFLLVTTPNENWRFPYYKMMRPLCPSEKQMFKEWGHVRRGYSLSELMNLIDIPHQKCATFISPITILCHDVGFSHLSGRMKRMIGMALSPLTWAGYLLHNHNGKGTETASAWKKTKES